MPASAIGFLSAEILTAAAIFVAKAVFTVAISSVGCKKPSARS